MNASGGIWPRIRLPLQIVLLAAVYFVSAKLSLLLAIPPGYATALWPPSGIALASLLVLGSRVWPGIWLGALLVNLTISDSPLPSVLIAIGNTLEALAGAALVRRHIAPAAPFFDRARNVVKFVAIAALCSAIAATTGVMSISLGSPMSSLQFVANWATWWHGDTAGIIIVAPLILTWNVRQDVEWTRAKIAEIAVFIASLLVVSFLVFGVGARDFDTLPLTFLILPFIIWAAFRFSRREVTTAIALTCAIAIADTVDGSGPFALGTVNLSMVALLAFVSTIVTTGLMMSAAVSERARAMERLEQALMDLRQQATKDPLTGLPNRREMWDFLQREWIRARRSGNTIAVIMIDLDHFKSINDAYGHGAGDLVLMEVGRVLLARFRGSDIACRFGGEEFAVVLPDAGESAALRRAEDIRRAIGSLALTYRGAPLKRITASFGIALLPQNAADPGALLLAADEALYVAKSTGRDRIVLSTASAELSRHPS